MQLQAKLLQWRFDDLLQRPSLLFKNPSFITPTERGAFPAF
jgi:hypothetical protein